MEGREKGRKKGRKEKKVSTDMLERELRIVLQAPNPSRRDAFLAEAPRFYMGHGSFVLAQAAYIRKWVWVISVILLGALADIAARWPREALWVAAGMMPFLALTAMQEHLRSSMYNMTELELSTRFSVKSILLARMGLLGSFHLILLLLLLPFLVLQVIAYRHLSAGALSADHLPEHGPGQESAGTGEPVPLFRGGCVGEQSAGAGQ